MPDIENPAELSADDLLAAAIEELPEPVDTPAEGDQDGDAPETSEALADAVAPQTPAEAVENPSEPSTDAPASAGEPTPDDFSDDKPWTPERVKNARALLEQQRTQAHDLYQEAIGRARKFQRRYDNFQAEKQQLQVERQQFLTGLQALRQGTPEQRLTAIQLLTGQDGVKWFEEMSFELANGGKAREIDPTVAALRDQIGALTNYIQQREQNDQLMAQQREHEARLNEWKDAVTAQVAARPDIAPVSSIIATKMPGRYREAIFEVKMAEYQKRGSAIDDATAVAILEGQLKAERDLYHSEGTTGSGPAADERTAAANLETTPSAPPLTPSLAAQQGGGRVPVDEAEAIQAVAQELDESFWKTLGVM